MGVGKKEELRDRKGHTKKHFKDKKKHPKQDKRKIDERKSISKHKKDEKITQRKLFLENMNFFSLYRC